MCPMRCTQEIGHGIAGNENLSVMATGMVSLIAWEIS
jgi:hypothetical protein